MFNEMSDLEQVTHRVGLLKIKRFFLPGVGQGLKNVYLIGIILINSSI